MSRRSLRLNTTSGPYGGEDNMLNMSPHTARAASRRDAASRGSSSRQSHSGLHTPKMSNQRLQGPSSSFSNASLISSMLDESYIRERTVVEDQALHEDTEARESTALENTILLPNRESSSDQTNGYYCDRCSVRPCTGHSSTHVSSTPTSLSRLGAREALTAGPGPASFPPSRDKHRKLKTAGTMFGKGQKTRGPNQDGGPLWRAAVCVVRCLRMGWNQAVLLVSAISDFVFRWCLPKLLRLLPLLLPCLLLLGLWYVGPSTLLSALPALNLTQWEMTKSLVSLGQSSVEERGDAKSPASLGQSSVETHGDAHPAPPFIQSSPAQSPRSGDPSWERVLRLEQSLSVLWERLEAADRRQAQHQQEVTRLHQALQDGLHAQARPASMEPWLARLLEDRLSSLQAEMEEKKKAEREESRQQYEKQQEQQESRLAEVELRQQALALGIEEVQKKQESIPPAPTITPAPVPVSVGVDRESHDAVLAEVERLRTALGDVRENLLGVTTGCEGTWEALDTLQDTVTAQVRQELRSLVSGGDSDPGSLESDLPSSLLRWLSERYVGTGDLQASLSALEGRILHNVSLRLQQDEKTRAAQSRGAQSRAAQTFVQTLGAATATGITEEHVELIVQKALKLYSQDRTGLTDYALESGGGSILSTRCSETYTTRDPLLSLFGVPLMYYSQSPRVTIQPDVHPGNCWAFQGTSGYLVIRLSNKIRPNAFSMEHLPRDLSPGGVINSAPRQFSVYGLDDVDQEVGKFLGTYSYEQDGEALQTFWVSEENKEGFQIIELQILSNWGRQEYTCLYRFRVHGELSD